ncbi:septum formation inhibitor Maf [Idiomarina loihiensis]|jgi:MAF protein|uniref:7-methyl-GTP pyrophosphatase n=1 Tax=Idiomarina loihiensis (strain ATCC BAA-735 / DSM 15497 / L2-TR) TaxID=283942 RepID=NTPPB_IDILO|nr:MULTISPECIES: Maf family protein [Idiomarina]Q5QZ35.1 RecName: Full=7-methyl-GTP pyrophosphatase; Short=m(7)GTP pyrophosphatase [Idiomarina loihiensis L2TR]AAV82186.1 Nucleotide-binding protein implicated in inhibition of septum formation [Idiomarina loihiensis L2TR]AGM36216.1 nucleotide-binding protein implicated in inhibition of septum formation [Idiomarina loihiensis GSL 199]MRJ43983.1 septum formation inhibitor Maf [Idiomarina loihiensis]UTW33888.1 septum formation inhibitor Maf [Idioma
MTLPLILGSGSKYRREILDRLHLNYDVVKPDIDESAISSESPQQLVGRLAEAKARAVEKRMTYDNAIIIGSDQVAVCDGNILGKPGNRENAVRQLSSFIGKTVTFYTGLAVFNTEAQQCEVRVEPFEVEFRQLTAEEIERYVELENPFDCAGSFKSEGLGISLFSGLKGNDPNTLIGLPAIALLDMLRTHGINPLNKD